MKSRCPSWFSLDCNLDYWERSSCLVIHLIPKALSLGFRCLSAFDKLTKLEKLTKCVNLCMKLLTGSIGIGHTHKLDKLTYWTNSQKWKNCVWSFWRGLLVLDKLTKVKKMCMRKHVHFRKRASLRSSSSNFHCFAALRAACPLRSQLKVNLIEFLQKTVAVRTMWKLRKFILLVLLAKYSWK